MPLKQVIEPPRSPWIVAVRLGLLDAPWVQFLVEASSPQHAMTVATARASREYPGAPMVYTDMANVRYAQEVDEWAAEFARLVLEMAFDRA